MKQLILVAALVVVPSKKETPIQIARNITIATDKVRIGQSKTTLFTPPATPVASTAGRCMGLLCAITTP